MSIPSPLTMLRRLAPCQAPGQAAIAPSRMLSDVSGTSSSSVTSCTTPSPWHRGQAPTGGIRGERLGLEPWGPGWIGPSARVEHPQQVGKRGDGADRRSHLRCSAPLLQGDGWWQSGDLLDVRRGELMEEAAGVRRHRLEVATLRLCIEGTEGERGLPGARDAGEGDHRIAGNVDVDALEVVLAGAPDVHEVVGRSVLHSCLIPSHRHGDPSEVRTASGPIRRPTETAAGADRHSRVRRYRVLPDSGSLNGSSEIDRWIEGASAGQRRSWRYTQHAPSWTDLSPERYSKALSARQQSRTRSCPVAGTNGALSTRASGPMDTHQVTRTRRSHRRGEFLGTMSSETDIE